MRKIVEKNVKREVIRCYGRCPNSAAILPRLLSDPFGLEHLRGRAKTQDPGFDLILAAGVQRQQETTILIFFYLLGIMPDSLADIRCLLPGENGAWGPKASWGSGVVQRRGSL